MLTFHIITIFPHVFEPYFNTSIIKRAQQKGLIKIKIHNLRDFTKDRRQKVALRQAQGNREPRRTIDDKPYGGGPGMILKIEPIYKAIRSISRNSKFEIRNSKIVLLTPAGKQFDQKMAKSLSKLNQLVLICGRYEGVDARVEKFVDEKISVGPYVLSGGELPAMAIVEAITRLVPGVIKAESLKEETFSMAARLRSPAGELRRGARFSNQIKDLEKIGEYPQFTRPEVLTIREKNAKIKILKVPKVLLSGNHQAIQEWREKCQKFSKN